MKFHRLIEPSTYHQEMLEKYKDVKADDVKISADGLALIAFNGYYTLDTAPGAFFAVDTNLYISSLNDMAPIYDLSLIVSLDGKTSFLVPFTGSFDGTNLSQPASSTQFGVDLILQHTVGTSGDGTTASVEGTITLSNSSPTEVKGTTYNNPIPIELYTGTYYTSPSPSSCTSLANKICQTLGCLIPVCGSPLPVMKIGENTEVHYDFGADNGQLKLVPTYVYNMNMYYFTFHYSNSKGKNTVSLIMGTAAEGGFACIDMVAVASQKNPVTRMLQTIPYPNEYPLGTPNPASNELANFSGYYTLPTIGQGAFISIQSESLPMAKLNLVKIGVSMDGTTSNGYYFIAERMSFMNNKLTMEDQGIEIVFKQEYDPSNRSIVSISGKIKEVGVAGFTLFNPVPLSVFGGVPLTDGKGNSLTVVSDEEISYNGNVITSFTYISIMYILAVESPSMLLSFGTSGVHGNTCIVFQGTGTNVVYAIP